VNGSYSGRQLLPQGYRESGALLNRDGQTGRRLSDAAFLFQQRTREAP
jgi:hypothetical protein